MPTASREIPAKFALLALICIAGCGRQATEYGVAQSDIGWMTSATNAVPGLDEASVTFITLKAGPPGGVPLVVWSDLHGGTVGHGEGSARGAFFEGYHRAAGGRQFDFHAKTTDGKAASITIAGTDYDLANGQLFLVSAQRDPIAVAQNQL